MKTKTNFLILSSLTILLMCACGGKVKQSLPTEEKTVEPVFTQAESDTISIHIKDAYSTPYMNDDNLQEYYTANNKYKNWDKNDPKMVIIKLGCAKDGSSFDVELMKTCGEDKLDKEAVRLIENIVMDNPAKDALGNPLRVRNMLIPIQFPTNK